MNKPRQLPVLNFAPFRRYPSKLERQEFDDDREVCGSCLSGACCTSEDPIYLTSFDVFRLASFFDISPAEFLNKFTQDSFAGEDSQQTRRPWIDDPASSKVTYLRRRENSPFSPCIFLKYITEEDGTPRRICSVHDARPLSCREFYYDSCKTRFTGELAALLAEGFEKIRDGEITREVVNAQIKRLSPHDFTNAPQNLSLEYSFWLEMKRAIDPDSANTEGANSYKMAPWQDPLDEKLNRVLSATYLRFEEKYGPEPNGEQLMPFTSGLSFARSPERSRIFSLLKTAPQSDLYSSGNFPFYSGLRTMVPGVKEAERFATIPPELIYRHVQAGSGEGLFSRSDEVDVRLPTSRRVGNSLLLAINHLICFASRLAVLENLLELELPGRYEFQLMEIFSRLRRSRLAGLSALRPYFDAVLFWAAESAFDWLKVALSCSRGRRESGSRKPLLASLELAGRVANATEAVGLPSHLRRLYESLVQEMLVLFKTEQKKGALYRMGEKGAWIPLQITKGKHAVGGRLFTQWAVQLAEFKWLFTLGLIDGDEMARYVEASLEALEKLINQQAPVKASRRVWLSLAENLGDLLEVGGYVDERRLSPDLSQLVGKYFDRYIPLKSGGNSVPSEPRYLVAEVPLQSDAEEAPNLNTLVQIYRRFKIKSYEWENYIARGISEIIAHQQHDGGWASGSYPPLVPASQELYYDRQIRLAVTHIDALLPFAPKR